MTGETIELGRARAFWFQRQGLALPAPTSADLAHVIARTGWLRTLGGADVYLAARARVLGLGRAQLDAAVAAGALRVIPAVRGCIYLVPGVDAPWVLRVAEEAWRPRAEKEVDKAGATWREVEELARAVVRVIGAGMGTDAIRRALPDGAVKSLGEAGKKAGMSSLLPTALRLLEFEDRIERTLDGGRLDSERYTWRAIAAPVRVAMDSAARRAKLAELFFAQAGPATLAHFAAWAGLSQKDARAAANAIDVVPVVVEGVGDAHVLARDLAALRAARAADTAALLSFEDNYLVLHGGPGIVTDPAYHAIELAAFGADAPQPIGTTAHMLQRSIVIGGMVVGLWELDEAAGAGVWAPLGKGAIAASRAKELDALVADAARFLVGEIGHAKSFTLDTAALVAARAASIKRLRGSPRAGASPSRAARPARAARASASRRGSTTRARPRSRTRG